MKTKIQSYQNLLDASKAVLKGNYIAVIDNIVKEKRSQINNGTFYLKKLEIQQTKLKSSRINKI